MNKIRIKTELKDWLIDNITNTIHDLEIENSENFNKWAKTFKKENAELVVNMEFINDWGYDEREYITEKEASEYSQILMQKNSAVFNIIHQKNTPS